MVIAFCSAGLFAACASGNTEQGLGAGGFGGGSLSGPTSGPGPTTGPTTTSTSGGLGGSTTSGPGTSTSTSGGTGCAAKCNIDADCQNTCQAPPSGVYCCDTMNSMCYLSSNSTCQAVTTGPGSSSSSSGY
jgi:hypothetical protein